MKSSSDIAATIRNAIVSGTRIKVVMRMADPDDAAYMQRVLHQGFIDYAQYKAGTERPAAIGNEKVILHGTSQSIAESTHETYARTRGSSRGHAVGRSTSNTSGIGESSGTGDSSGLVLAPPPNLLGPSAPNASIIPYALSQSIGEQSSRGTSQQSANSLSESEVAVDVETDAETHGFGTSRARTKSQSAHESYITQYQSMPSQLFSAAEQAERLAGEIMNLALRECFIKIDNQRPIRTRTADLPPAFRSSYFKRIVMPLFSKAIARSPYLLPAAQVDAAIAARVSTLTPPPPQEPDFTAPVPMPVLDRPESFAKDFWSKRRPPGPDDEPPKPKPKKPRGRKPMGDLPPGADRFRVIDGDGDKRK